MDVLLPELVAKIINSTSRRSNHADKKTVRSLLICKRSLSNIVRNCQDLIHFSHEYKDLLDEYFSTNTFPKFHIEQTGNIAIGTKYSHHGLVEMNHDLPITNPVKTSCILLDNYGEGIRFSKMEFGREGMVNISIDVGGLIFLKLPEKLLRVLKGNKIDLICLLRQIYITSPFYQPRSIIISHTQDIEYYFEFNNIVLDNIPKICYKYIEINYDIENVVTRTDLTNKYRLRFSHVSLGILILIYDDNGNLMDDLVKEFRLQCNGRCFPELKVNAELCKNSIDDYDFPLHFSDKFYFFQIKGNINFSRLDNVTFIVEWINSPPPSIICFFNFNYNYIISMGGIMGTKLC